MALPLVDRQKSYDRSAFEEAEAFRQKVLDALRENKPLFYEMSDEVAAVFFRIPAYELRKHHEDLTVFGIQIGEKGIIFEVTPPKGEQVPVEALRVSSIERAKYFRRWYRDLARAYQYPVRDEIAVAMAVPIIRELAQPMGLRFNVRDGSRLSSLFDTQYPDIFTTHREDFRIMQENSEFVEPNSREQLTRYGIGMFLDHFWTVIGATGEAHIQKNLYSPELLRSAMSWMGKIQSE